MFGMRPRGVKRDRPANVEDERFVPSGERFVLSRLPPSSSAASPNRPGLPRAKANKTVADVVYFTEPEYSYMSVAGGWP
jgi:hypothetical protein